jgi:hypothetical protein
VAKASALRVQEAGVSPLPPAAQAYQRELARAERLRAQLDELNQVCPAHQLEAARRLGPLTQRQRDLQRRLVHRLDQWLDSADSGLSRAQQSILRDTLCQRAEVLAEAGDTTMASVHDRRSPLSLAQKRQARADQLRERLGDALGVTLAAELRGEDPDALLQAAIERLHADRAAQAQRRQARREARMARAKARGPAATALAGAQMQQDADSTLRGIYRQLASALHPDRETDEQEKRRKTDLMSEANAAYDRKDLVSLMELQRRADRVVPEELGRLPEHRLKAMTLLLRQQVAELERERQAAQQRWLHQLQCPPGTALSAPALQALLAQREHGLQAELAGLEDDLRATQDLAALKPWLNRQRHPPAAGRSPP